MWNSRSYQLVSEHSILSAQRYNRVAAMEEILEKQAQHRKTEWKAEIDKINQRLERRRRRCDDELSEKEFEVYLEMKLEWLQQFYVTGSTKSEKKIKESEEEGWNESSEEDLKFWKLEASKPEERRDKYRETLERMKEILDAYLSNVAAKSSKPEETKESEKEERIEGSSGVPWNVIAKSEVAKEEGKSETEHGRSDGGCGDEIGGDRDSPWKPTLVEELTVEDSSETPYGGTRFTEEVSLAELTTETSDGDAIAAELCVSHNLRKQIRDEEEAQSEEATLEALPEESPPEKDDGGATIEAVKIVYDERKQLLSLVTECCDLFGSESGASADGFSGEMGLLIDPMGQAQYLICTPPQVTNREWVLQEVKGRDSERKTRAVWELEDLDLTHNSVGQAQVQVSKYGNSYMNRGVLGVIRGLKNINPHLCTFLAEAFPCVWEGKNTNISSETAATLRWDQNINISALSPLINVEGMGRYANLIDFSENFALIHGVTYCKNSAAAILCFVLKIAVENKTFDPGGNFSVLLVWNQCFNIIHPFQQYMCLSFTVESFMAFSNFNIEDYAASLALVHDQQKMLEFEAWNHINLWVQGESEISKEAIDLLCEWLMGFVGELTRTIENKLLELHDKEEERNSVFTEFGWHKLMVEHLSEGLEFSRRPMREAHHKQWDPGELYSTSCIIATSCFKLWDPGGRLLMVCFGIFTLRTR